MAAMPLSPVIQQQTPTSQNLTPGGQNSTTGSKLNSNSIYSLIERAKQKKVLLSPSSGAGGPLPGDQILSPVSDLNTEPKLIQRRFESVKKLT